MKLFSVGKILCEKLKAVEFYFHSIVDPSAVKVRCAGEIHSHFYSLMKKSLKGFPTKIFSLKASLTSLG